MTDAFRRAADVEANTPIAVGAREPTPEELAKTHLAVSIDRYRNEIPKVPISTLIFEAYLAGLAEGERRRQKRVEQLENVLDRICDTVIMRGLVSMELIKEAAAILAEGGGE